MKRSCWTAIPVAVSLLLVALTGVSCQPALHVGPYLPNVSADSAVIMWETTEPVVGAVAYGDPTDPTTLVREPAAAALHQVKLTGLSPATQYGYRVSWPGYEGEVQRFRTLPPPAATRFRVVVYGDSRTGIAVHAQIADLIVAQDPALVINTGDLTEDGRKLEQWKPQCFDPLATLWRSIPLFVALGNHEQNADNAYRYLALPDHRSWYAFDCGTAHFIVLDPNVPFDAGTPQYQWLEQELDSAKDPNRWLIAVFHQPMYSSFPQREVNANRWAWERLFERHAVDLTLNGHDHYYARTYPIGPLRPFAGTTRVAPGARYGTVHIVAGGGGAPLYPCVAQPYNAFAQSTHGFTVLDLDGLQIQGQTFDLDGNVIDRFVLHRGQPQPAEEYCAYDPLIWERDARASARRVLAGLTGQVDADRTITAKSSLPMRVVGEVTWQVPDRWTLTPATDHFSVEPGGELRLQFHVKGSWAKTSPVPTATVRLTEADGGFDFRNREFSFALTLPVPPRGEE